MQSEQTSRRKRRYQDTLGDFIRYMLETYELTVAEFCRQSGIPRRTIDKYLSGEFRPGPEMVQRLATALGVPVRRVQSHFTNLPEGRPRKLGPNSIDTVKTRGTIHIG